MSKHTNVCGLLKNSIYLSFLFKKMNLNHSKQYIMKVSNQPSQAEKRNEFAQEIKRGKQLKMKYFVLFKLQM